MKRGPNTAPMTYRQIARRLGVTHTHVQRIERAALAKLRAWMVARREVRT